MPFYKHLGIKLTGLSWGRSEARLVVSEKLTQDEGVAHGGVAASLVDSAVGLALCTMLCSQEPIATVELSVNFIASAKPGLLIARGRILHMGNHVAVGDAVITDRKGKLIARGTATYMVLGNRDKRIYSVK
jgi:acyl-CoA thioesterase